MFIATIFLIKKLYWTEIIAEYITLWYRIAGWQQIVQRKENYGQTLWDFQTRSSLWLTMWVPITTLNLFYHCTKTRKSRTPSPSPWGMEIRPFQQKVFQSIGSFQRTQVWYLCRWDHSSWFGSLSYSVIISSMYNMFCGFLWLNYYMTVNPPSTTCLFSVVVTVTGKLLSCLSSVVKFK